MGDLMLFLILSVSGMLLASGMYFILAQALQLPRIATTKAVLNVARQDKKQTKNMEVIIFELASKLSKFIRMDDYKKRKMTATLKSAGIKLTPETYVAKAWVKSGLIAALLIPVLPILPILAPVIILLAIAVLFKEVRLADKFFA
jgi:flagellar protein FlaJ